MTCTNPKCGKGKMPYSFWCVVCVAEGGAGARMCAHGRLAQLVQQGRWRSILRQEAYAYLWRLNCVSKQSCMHLTGLCQTNITWPIAPPQICFTTPSHKCLKNRHGEDAEEAAVSGAWVCPPCRGSCGPGCVTCCNCGPCRKKVRGAGGRVRGATTRAPGPASLPASPSSMPLSPPPHIVPTNFNPAAPSPSRPAWSPRPRWCSWRAPRASPTSTITWCTW